MQTLVSIGIDDVSSSSLKAMLPMDVVNNALTHASCRAPLADETCAARGYTLAKVGDIIENNW